MKILALIALSCLVFINARSQNRDYVITNGGDTLKGVFIGEKFKGDGWDKARTVDYQGYKELFKAKGIFVGRPILVPENPRRHFIRVLENGKINLYKFLPDTRSVYVGKPDQFAYDTTKVLLYVSKGTDSLIKLDYSSFSFIHSDTLKKRMEALGGMLSDKKDVYNKFIGENKFTIAQIQNIVHLYNTGHALPDILSDYIIRNQKDTVVCDIELSNTNPLGRYRLSPKTSFVQIDTSVTGYFLGRVSQSYILKTLPNNRKGYVKLLIKGRINLYSYSQVNSPTDDNVSLYISKGPDDLVLIQKDVSSPQQNEEQAFVDLISDDASLVQNFKSLSYNFTTIAACIRSYNGNNLNRSK